MRKTTRFNFTLIELVAVMAIMGILLTLMLPSFKRMIAGNAVDRMATQLKGSLEKAQAEAVTSRKYVALFLPSTIAGSKIDAQYRFGGARMAYVTREADKNGNYTWKFDRWVPTSEWVQPEAEAILLKVIKESGNVAVADDTLFTKLTDSTAAGAIKAGEGVKFLSSDTTSAITYNALQDVEDCVIVEGGSKADEINSAVIFSPYGGILGSVNVNNSAAADTEKKARNLLFVVSEVAQNGDTLVYPSRDATGPTNFVLLELNRYTGRVNYRNLN